MTEEEREPLRYHLRVRRFDPKILAATERFFRSDPWGGTAAEKDAKFKTWIREVSEIYEVPVPGFAVVPEEECPQGGGYFEGAIIIPKYSVLTCFYATRWHVLLHRKLKPRTMRIVHPEDCLAYAASLFYVCRPQLYLKAVAEGRVYNP